MPILFLSRKYRNPNGFVHLINRSLPQSVLTIKTYGPVSFVDSATSGVVVISVASTVGTITLGASREMDITMVDGVSSVSPVTGEA
jgi:hypothetical protein